MGVRERLAGRRLLLTGSTGFVGEAVLERVLCELPETRLVLVVRAMAGSSAQERVAALLAKPAFGTLHERLGTDGVAALAGDRIEVLEGDLDEHVPALPRDIDVVIHCAGAVSFDPPIDEGFQTNLGGTRRLLEAVLATGARPHVVHVSTAYVAGLRQGFVAEGRHPHEVDWRAEQASAVRARAAAEDASRTPAVLRRLLAACRREFGPEGPQAVAAEAERRRVAWVRERLVATGTERAASLGFTDCYTFTKALAERMVEEVVAGLPLTIARPSIIESALRRPYPGWIEGFKMAEPIILAYGRGELADFPALPDGALDVIPVDFVVSAMLVAASLPPEPSSPRYLHIASSARNPLRFERLYELVREYFQAHPLPARDRGTLAVPEWRFRGPSQIERLLRTAEHAHKAADWVVGALPPGGRTREVATRLDRTGRRLRFIRRYADLYRSYALAALTYCDDEARALGGALEPAEVADWSFDPAEIDWRHYLVEVHCPAVTLGLRWLAATPTRQAPTPLVLPVAGAAAAATGHAPVLAVFDLDGTVVASTVVEAYLALRMADRDDRLDMALEAVRIAARVPSYLRAERRDRGALLRSVYARYAGVDPALLADLVDEHLTGWLLERAAPAALRRVRAHRAAGHRTVLITGAIAEFVRPLAPLFDEVVAARLALGPDGLATGRLAEPPVVGEARVAWLRRYAHGNGADLAEAHAYADSRSDLPMLAAVGYPVAVNPDLALARKAKQEGWPLVSWRLAGGTVRLALPGPAGAASVSRMPTHSGVSG